MNRSQWINTGLKAAFVGAALLVGAALVHSLFADRGHNPPGYQGVNIDIHQQTNSASPPANAPTGAPVTATGHP